MLFQRKKAQGMPVNVIILAAIGLFVLFIVVFMFYNKSAKFSSDLESCFTKLGTCVPSSSDCSDGNIVQAKCAGTQVCCARLSAGS